MKRIMIILIPLFLIACNANNADYVTKQEFESMQKELISKIDKHQLDINSLVKDLDSLYQKVSANQNYEDAEVLKNMIIKVEALHQTVSRTKKYEDNDLLLNLVGKVAGLEYELEQLTNNNSNNSNNSSATHTHSSIPSHTHTTSSSTSIPNHTHTSIPSHTHTASTTSSVGDLDANLLRQIMCVTAQNYRDIHSLDRYIQKDHQNSIIYLNNWRAAHCGTILGVENGTPDQRLKAIYGKSATTVKAITNRAIDFWWR